MTNRRSWPIVVGGCHRSGTSLVRRILNAHSRIHCGPEAGFFRDFYDTFVDDPLRSIRFMTAGRGLLPEEDLFAILGRAFLGIHERAAALAGKPRWADKDPSNVIYLSDWERLIGEDWGFIHVARNPLDTLASIKEAQFRHTIPEGLTQRIAFYKDHVQAGLDFAAAHPDRYHRVVYEDLVTEPESVVAALMSWLGEEFEPGQLFFNQMEHGIGLEDSKIEKTAGIHNRSVGRWQSLLTRHEADEIARCCSDVWTGIDSSGKHERLFELYRARHDEYLRSKRRLRKAVETFLPADATVAVISKGDDTLLELGDRQAWHFPRAEDGRYAGHHPGSSAEAIIHLQMLRARGVEYLVIPNSAFWWLEHYREFREHLEQHHDTVVRDGGSCLILRLEDRPTSQLTRADIDGAARLQETS